MHSPFENVEERRAACVLITRLPGATLQATFMHFFHPVTKITSIPYFNIIITKF